MDTNPKNQVVERLREAQNVLVTVSTDPSVDQLAAAVGFTLLMNKLGKHATAVFSGKIPSTIEFLKPGDTLEQNTNSLRDFIIALDKSKADKLRYKVEEDVVKIFITPYRTSLSQSDLDFSQGDFNVDVVVALGVDQQEHIDQAIQAHGRILHDATVIGVMAGQSNVELGNINWQDTSASSLCEMLVSISEAFQSGLLDSQMATAFLTGIVAQTERFSNDKTTPKVMTMAAQLMAAGANQQLIANELALPPEPPEVSPVEDLSTENESSEPTDSNEEGVISLHDQHEPATELPKPEEIHIDEQGVLHTPDELAAAVNDVQNGVQNPITPKEKVEEPEFSKYVSEPPQTGGTLTANSIPEPLDPSTDPLSEIPAASLPISTDDQNQTTDDNPQIGKTLGPDVEPTDTLTDIEKTVGNFEGNQTESTPLSADTPDENEARKAVSEAVNQAGYDADRPKPLQSLGAQPLSDNDQTTTPPIVPPPLPFPLPPNNDDTTITDTPNSDEKLPPPPSLS